MNRYEARVRDCKLGIKAMHNVLAASKAFERLIKVMPSNDHSLISALFHMGVIRYAKPFLNTDMGTSSVRYPTKHLKKLEGFKLDLHDHLIYLRNTLVAHDDFDEITPKLLTFGFNIDQIDLHIPVSIALANKSISHPANIETAVKIHKHISAAVEGISNKLDFDIQDLRSTAIANPEQAKEAQLYKKDYGKQNFGQHELLKPPDFMDDAWLKVQEPDFSYINNGFVYEEMRVRRDFVGPEKIMLPDGNSIELGFPKRD